MSMFPVPLSSRLRAGRPSGPRCRGGASSLLRLSNPAASRLPTRAELADWADRAGQALSIPPGDEPALPLFVRLQPSPGVGHVA